jgi:hypothetical protein
MLTENGINHYDTYRYDEAEIRAKISRHERGYEDYPDCWDEDQKSLDELLATIRERCL